MSYGENGALQVLYKMGVHLVGFDAVGRRQGFNRKIRILQTVNLLIAIAGIIWLIWRESRPELWLGVSLFFFVAYGFLGINVGLHRLLSHRSFKVHSAWEIFLSLVSVPATVGSTISWVGLHRYHHAQSDTEKDPHSPHHIGSARAWWGFWKRVLVPPMVVKDLLGSRFHKSLHRNYFKFILGYVFLLGLIDPKTIVFAYCLPATMTLHGTSAVSVLGHKIGYQNFPGKDHSTNSILLWFLSLGEGWHNNHHHRPGAVRQGVRWWELDPAARFISFIASKQR